MSTDLIRDLLDKVLAAVPSFTREMASELEQQIRAEWGGEEIYVGKTTTGRRGRPSIPIAVQQKAYIDGKTDVPTADLTRKHGISRSTLYRLMKRGPKE